MRTRRFKSSPVHQSASVRIGIAACLRNRCWRVRISPLAPDFVSLQLKGLSCFECLASSKRTDRKLEQFFNRLVDERTASRYCARQPFYLLRCRRGEATVELQLPPPDILLSQFF